MARVLRHLRDDGSQPTGFVGLARSIDAFNWIKVVGKMTSSHGYWGWAGATLLVVGLSTMGCATDLGELRGNLTGADGGGGNTDTTPENQPLRVDAEAAAGGDGLSWESAYSDLQAAVDAQAEAGGGAVWVARGTYTPDEKAAQALRLRDGVEVYGGFAGDETRVEERDLDDGLTRLDAAGAPHVVWSAVPSARLDGFVLTGGAAEGEEADGLGGGMYIRNASEGFLIAGCEVVENSAIGGGAGLYIEDSSLTIRDTLIDANSGLHGAGGVHNLRSLVTFRRVTLRRNDAVETAGGMVNRQSKVSLLDSTIEDNASGTATQGGAVANLEGSTLEVEQTRFYGNFAEFGHGGHVFNEAGSLASLENAYIESGGAEELGGAFFNAGELRIRDSMVVDVVAPDAGALYNDAQGHAEIVNSTFARNRSYFAKRGAVEGGAIYNAGVVAMINVTLEGGSADACSGQDCADGVLTDEGGETTLANVVYAGVEFAAHEGASLDIAHSCELPADDTSYAEVDADGDGDAELYLQPGTACVDAGSSAVADEAGIDWANLTTHANGCLDSAPTDPGHHHPSSVEDSMTCSAPVIASSAL